MINPIFNKIKEKIHRIRVLKNLSYLPGHFYSPVVIPEEIQAQLETIFRIDKSMSLNLDINENEQLDLLENIKQYYNDLPFTYDKKEGLRYYYDNIYFSYNSAIELFGIIRHFKPRQIIEIGSGFSSALMLDVNDIFFEGNIKCIFIEPYPDRLISLFKSTDIQKKILIKDKVQNVNLSIFKELNENDILFIDSSHVSKVGSDLNHIMFNILPILNKGVIIHFHDVFYPFEYPKEWVLSSGGFGWNENYLLRAFLMYNSSFKIILFNSYMEYFHKDWFIDNMPDCLLRQGGSIFIKKVD
jgi:hypothetical protein